MFVLAELEDTVKVEPSAFGKKDHDAITDVLNEKYANKVVQEVGLCICVFDILQTSERFILYGDGCAYIKVSFRMTVFRPYIGEVLVGHIKSCSPHGIRVSLGFFDDIHLPQETLLEGTRFNTDEQVWVWHYEGEKLFMDIDEPIRFKVLGENFTDATPSVHPSGSSAGRRQSVADTTASNDLVANSTKIPPYSLTGTIQQDGLGLLSWWES
ncbi:DNA-directed RNA polymerase III subunit RPC8-like protein [Gongronella butleri]|nr:DNA-directed RNA polymerase III subunit RPC8-like protein [Gongronella butleri]